MKTIASIAATLVAVILSGPTLAQTVEVKDAWVRSTVQGQQATGAFMKITAAKDARLVSVSSPVAGVSEVHEMKMDGDVMRMRAVEGGLALPAGKPVELKPGGYHLMLMDIKTALKKDTTIPLTLVVRDGSGVETKLTLQVPVASVPPVAAAMDHSHHP
jgi:copper(I)-binding protein